MVAIVPLFEDVFLKLTPDSSSGKQYATAGIRKGLLLCKDGNELSEEAVGFGVPVVKRGLETVFPGEVELAFPRGSSRDEILATFSMNLVERLAAPDRRTLQNEKLYTVKNNLAALYRRFPVLRPALTAASSGLRRFFRWETAYEKKEYYATIPVRYWIQGEEGRIATEIDLGDLSRNGMTELAVMNEQGGHFFNRYRDSDGADLSGRGIGGWDAVAAERASFLCEAHKLAFTLRQASGARLFRGRELVGSRLAWSGFGYVIVPAEKIFHCEVRVEKIP